MHKLNTEETRSLNFKVDIHNIDHKQLKGSFKFVLDGIEVGVPVEILEDMMTATIPPLSNYVKTLKHGEVVKGVLEVFGNGFYLKPWEDEFQLSSPVKVEAQMYQGDGIDLKSAEQEISKTLTATLNDSENISPDTEKEIVDAQGAINSGETTVSGKDKTKDDLITRSEMKEMLEDILGSKKEKVVETPKPKKLVSITSATGQKYKVTEKVAKEIQKVTEQKNKKVSSKNKRIVNTGDEISNDIIAEKLNQLKSKAGITSDMESRFAERSGTDPKQLMESMGMKNPKVQEAMLEKATEKGGDDPDAQFDALKKMLETKGEI